MPLLFFHQILQLAQCSQVGNVLLESFKPRLTHHTANSEAWLFTPHNTFPQLQSPVVTCFTQLHPALGIALVDVRLACSCSDIEFTICFFPQVGEIHQVHDQVCNSVKEQYSALYNQPSIKLNYFSVLLMSRANVFFMLFKNLVCVLICAYFL